MSWHKMTLKVIYVQALLGHRCLGTHQLGLKSRSPRLPKRRFRLNLLSIKLVASGLTLDQIIPNNDLKQILKTPI